MIFDNDHRPSIDVIASTLDWLPAVANKNIKILFATPTQSRKLQLPGIDKLSQCLPGSLSYYRQANGGSLVVHYFILLKPSSIQCCSTAPREVLDVSLPAPLAVADLAHTGRSGVGRA